MDGARLHDPLAFAGRVEMVTVTSRALESNPLGDPHVRELPVYLPPGAKGGDAEYPLLFVLAGFTGRGQSYLDTHPWRRGAVWHFDQAVARGDTPPAILALPDAFTRLGGSQYVNSPAVGDYEDHVVDELLPLVRERYPVRHDRIGVLGKSSGGFGALHLAMQRPGTFQACASISGDCAFEYVYAAEMLACLRGLVPYDMDPARFLEEFERTHRLDGDGHAVINVLAMSACYSPNAASPLGFDLPMDLHTGERVEAVWRRWRAFDPLERVASSAEALQDLTHLHVECGLHDEFHLQWGLRRLVRELDRAKVSYEYEEHDGGHRGIDHRFEPVLRGMIEALAD